MIALSLLTIFFLRGAPTHCSWYQTSLIWYHFASDRKIAGRNLRGRRRDFLELLGRVDA